MAETPEETALCWELSRQNEYGSWKLHLFVFVSEVVPTQRLIDQAEGGQEWRTPEISSRMLSFYRRVLGSGYAHVYKPISSLMGESRSFRLSWSEASPDLDMTYHRHKIAKLGDETYDGAVRGLELIDRVLQRIKKLYPGLSDGNHQLDDPRFAVSALERTKGVVRVVRFDRSSDEPFTFVEDRSFRPRLRSEGVLSMFGY